MVIKADGLALGKGVLICENEEQAADGVKEIMLDKKFGASGNHVVVEEFLTGPEVSVLSFTDGKVVKPWCPAWITSVPTITTPAEHRRHGHRAPTLHTPAIAAECMERSSCPPFRP